MPGYFHESDQLVNRLMPAHNPDWRDRSSAWHDFIAHGGCDRVREFIRLKNYIGLDEDDILQETLITAYLKVEGGEYQDRALPFSAFLKRIAAYKILEAVRRWRSQQAASLDALDEVIGTIPAEHEYAEWHTERAAIHRVLGLLSPRRRAVILLEQQGYSTAEIAERLGITEVLVRKEKSLALRTMREALYSIAGLAAPSAALKAS